MPTAWKVERLTRKHSSTTLGIFTTPPDLPPSTSRPPTPSLAPHAEIPLGFVIGVLDEGCGEGATLHIRGMWVLREAEDKGVGQVLLKAFCGRMKDARVARKLEKSMSCVGDRENVLAWYKEAGFVVRDGGGGGVKLVADCY